jgi:hypothetical protein
MRQQTLAMQSGFEKFAGKSRRELFLDVTLPSECVSLKRPGFED